MHVVIRADGGRKIGYGHLVRTGALAAEFLRRGHRVTYATTTPEQIDDLCPRAVETRCLPSRTDPSAFVTWIRDSDVDVAVIDSYLADVDYQRAVRNQTRLVVFSDDTRHTMCADVVVNGNLYAPDLEYEFVGDDPTWLLGPDYVPLRKEIATLADQAPPWRDQSKRAIITMGGSDVANATPAAVEAFDGTQLRVDVVVGPAFSNEAEIQATAEQITAETEVVHNPSNLPALMFDADLAVGACGSTTYELLALGTPLICSPVAENQHRIASALSERDIAAVVDETRRKRGFRRSVERYVSDARIRRQHRDRGRSIVDGHGIERVCNKIYSLTEQDMTT